MPLTNYEKQDQIINQFKRNVISEKYRTEKNATEKACDESKRLKRYRKRLADNRTDAKFSGLYAENFVIGNKIDKDKA